MKFVRGIGAVESKSNSSKRIVIALSQNYAMIYGKNHQISPKIAPYWRNSEIMAYNEVLELRVKAILRWRKLPGVYRTR